VCDVRPLPVTYETKARYASFEALYNSEYSAVALVAGITCGEWAAGEDLAQEAFVRAHREWERVRNLDKPGAWVRRVAINLALTRRRGSDRRDRAVVRLGHETPRFSAPAEPQHHVWDAVAQLPPTQRAAVTLHYHDGCSTREIAEILDTSVSAVTTNLHKARTRLADLMGASS